MSWVGKSPWRTSEQGYCSLRSHFITAYIGNTDALDSFIGTIYTLTFFLHKALKSRTFLSQLLTRKKTDVFTELKALEKNEGNLFFNVTTAL